MNRLSILGILAPGLWAASPALAAVYYVGDQPLQLDLTETADFDYHFVHGNGNISPPSSLTYDPTSDKYLDWFNRFDARLTYGQWHAELRFDSAAFFDAPQASATSTLAEHKISQLLENRYINNLQLEKISASYLTGPLEATVGDFYINYGRGIVLSLRKIDALGVDTTLRGASITGRAGGFSLNVAGGVTNTVNTDQASGAVAPDPEDPIVASRLEYRLPKVFAIGIDGAILYNNTTTASYTPYSVGATPLYVPISPLGLGSVGVREAPTVYDKQRTENYSATFELPNLWDHGSFYLEAAHQFFYPYGETSQGNALYSGLNLFFGRFTVSAEYKAYLGYNSPTFSSLPSNIFLNFYQQDVYTNPPNLEEIFQEEDVSTDTYGPRLRLDYQLSEHIKPFVSVAYFVDNTNHYDIYDGFVGVEANWQQHRSHAQVSAGIRRQVFNSLDSTPWVLSKAEWWAQYDVVQALTPIYSLELDGLHRSHRDNESGVFENWVWGYAYLSLRRSVFTVSAGYEYYTQFPDLYQPNNVNGSFSWQINSQLLVRAFVGGREAGLRCINGVCRNFPGFNGASLEVVARY